VPGVFEIRQARGAVTGEVHMPLGDFEITRSNFLRDTLALTVESYDDEGSVTLAPAAAGLTGRLVGFGENARLELQPDASRGAAAAIMRANPFSAIFAHCQLTFSRSGARIPSVLHTRLTSHPGASAVSGVHSQTRPSSSVTRRDDIVGVSMGLDLGPATGDGLREPRGSNRKASIV
jgi:hypothetical protein